MSNENLIELNDRFAYHPADTDERKQAHENIREAARLLAVAFEYDLPAGREKAVALTKVEEAMFWANAAIARRR